MLIFFYIIQQIFFYCRGTSQQCSSKAKTGSDDV
jgi:hypothetical protein